MTTDDDIKKFATAVATLRDLGFTVGVMYPHGTGEVVTAVAFAHDVKTLNALVNGYLADDDTTRFFEREDS